MSPLYRLAGFTHTERVLLHTLLATTTILALPLVSG